MKKRMKVVKREQREQERRLAVNGHLLNASAGDLRSAQELQKRVIELESLLNINAEAPTEFERAELPLNTGDDEVWLNNRWQVNVRRWAGWGLFTGQTITHLSIKRLDKLPIHDWRDFQWIKNQIVGPEVEAFELYPAESRLVDGSNQYHLWCVEGLLTVGFSERTVGQTPLRLKLPDGSVTASVQRPFAPWVLPPDLAEREAEVQARLARVTVEAELRQSLVGKPAS